MIPTRSATPNSWRAEAPMMNQPTTSKEATGSAEETLVLMERMVTRLRARFINSV